MHGAVTADRAVQVVALLLRSSGKVDAPLPGWRQEQDFAHMLNRVLPDTVRVLGWADVPQDFHARCDADFNQPDRRGIMAMFTASQRSDLEIACRSAEASHDEGASMGAW